MLTAHSDLLRTRFLRDERAWLGLSDPWTAEDVLDRARRLQARIDRDAGLGPDVQLCLAATLPTAAVRLTAAQWGLVAPVEGRCARDLAWPLGGRVITTALEVARLARWGLLEPSERRAAAGVQRAEG